MIMLPGRIPLTISPYFWILVLLLGWLNSGSLLGIMIWIPVIFISVLIHELGHACTAKAFGQGAEIELVAYGGLTRRTGGSLKTWQEFLVIFNGPLAGFLIFVITYFIKPFFDQQMFPITAYALEIAMLVNLFWTFLNLLPVLPLDGGHLLKVLLEGAFGFRGTKFAFASSLGIATLLSVFFFLARFFIAGALFVMLAFESYRAWSELRRVREEDTNPEWHRLLREAQDEVRNGDKEKAISTLRKLQRLSKQGAIYQSATILLAQTLADQGNIIGAYNELNPLKEEISSAELRLLQQWAYQLQKWDDVTEVGSRAYSEQPSGQVAIFNALAHAIMGKALPAVGWLKCAKQFNIPNYKDILTKREFDAIRRTPEFQSLIE